MAKKLDEKLFLFFFSLEEATKKCNSKNLFDMGGWEWSGQSVILIPLSEGGRGLKMAKKVQLILE